MTETLSTRDLRLATRIELAELWELHRVPQYEVAEAMGVKPDYFSHLLSGRKDTEFMNRYEDIQSAMKQLRKEYETYEN